MCGYLEGSTATLLTDHKPLTALLDKPNLSGRQARWVDFLSRFHFEGVAWIPGKDNMADPQSRVHEWEPLSGVCASVSGSAALLVLTRAERSRQEVSEAVALAETRSAFDAARAVDAGQVIPGPEHPPTVPLPLHIPLRVTWLWPSTGWALDSCPRGTIIRRGGETGPVL
jgi:hypothetical protein